jgi:hypothetical protein
MARDYSKERKYDSQPHVKAKRAARNRARLKVNNARKAKGLSKLKTNQQVEHRDRNAQNNSLSNLRILSPKANTARNHKKG